MKTKRFLQNLALTLTGALLMGFLWRARGTNGWGAAWGLLNAGFVFTLFLTAALRRRKGPSLRLISLAAFSFMLTAPAWGTLLQQITGILGGAPEGAAPVYISPAAGLMLMALMGFGLAAVFGVLLGRCFSAKAWRWQDYIVLLAVFFIVLYGAKASVAHPAVRLLQAAGGGTVSNRPCRGGHRKNPLRGVSGTFQRGGLGQKD